MSTQVPWFRLGIRELRRLLRRTKRKYDRAYWREALQRAQRLSEKRRQGEA